jgi:hypothetical protein
MFGSAQMSIIPAKVAGVKQVYAFTPPVRGEGYYPATINAMKKAGADRLFILGGVPALALMAFGMGVVEPVDILCGAGNQYVAEAKRQLFGRCGIDLLAGPTEILVIADDGADPALVACDLLGQAEHDPNSGAALVCFSEAFGRKCLDELARQLAVLPQSQICRLAIKPGDDLSRSDWEQKVRPEILEWLSKNGLEAKIRCLVTVWDMPLRIGGRPRDAPARCGGHLGSDLRALPGGLSPAGRFLFAPADRARDASRDLLPREPLPVMGHGTGGRSAVQPLQDSSPARRVRAAGETARARDYAVGCP